MARFIHPIVAVKTVEAPNPNPNGVKPYRIVHTSFQSTSSCNIQSVNALNCCKVTTIYIFTIILIMFPPSTLFLLFAFYFSSMLETRSVEEGKINGSMGLK